jgi:hypothetical protein
MVAGIVGANIFADHAPAKILADLCLLISASFLVLLPKKVTVLSVIQLKSFLRIVSKPK